MARSRLVPRGFRPRRSGHRASMRIGRTEVRPVGGAPGCLAMLAFSVLASVLLTIILNLALR